MLAMIAAAAGCRWTSTPSLPPTLAKSLRRPRQHGLLPSSPTTTTSNENPRKKNDKHLPSPPAATMRSRAERVKRRAATVSLGTVRNRSSSVTVPTRTMVLLPSLLALWVCFTMREMERGGRFVFD